jgi:hypothetical protein
MNRPAIESLASFINQRRDIRFDYSDGSRCIFGFARIQHNIPEERSTIAQSSVNNVLGINSNQAARLFTDPMTRDGKRLDHPTVSRANAVETLKRFAETGVIFFNEPTIEDRRRGAGCGCFECRMRFRPLTRDDFQREREAMRVEAVAVDQQLRSNCLIGSFQYLDEFEGPQVVEVRELASEPSPRVEEPQTA